MKVRVLFFGATADVVGARTVEIAVSETAVAGDVIEQLHKKHPDLRGRNLLLAVNEQYTTENTPLTNGDELAIFTAVSGG
jgi:molybdopterin synthase sulfur carrier subunit